MLACQLWYGDRLSPSSGTAGNVPPAVQPPVDDENSVCATDPAAVRRTCVPVAPTPKVVEGCSRVIVPPGPATATPS